MTFTTYAEITIKIRALESDINGPDELQLSDAIYEIEEGLKQWLQQQAGDKFNFQVQSS